MFGGTKHPNNMSNDTEEWNYPSAPGAQKGQVWFNTVSNTLKGYAAQGTGAWASGGNANTARYSCGGTGFQTAAIVAGGYTTENVGIVESYNGSSWSEVGDLNTTRNTQGHVGGRSTAALAAGGEITGASDATESWNGTSWTEVAEYNTSRKRRSISRNI